MPPKRITRSMVDNTKDKIDKKKKNRALKTQKAKKIATKTSRKESNARERLLEYKREYMRARREKIREDPVEYENYCRSEKKRYYKRKEEGKIKMVQELSVKEQRAKRKYDRERKREYRALKKQQLMEDEQRPIKKKLVSVKESSRDQLRHSSQLAELKNQNLALKTALKKMTKKVQKLRSIQAKHADIIKSNALDNLLLDPMNDGQLKNNRERKEVEVRDTESCEAKLTNALQTSSGLERNGAPQT
ncbi:stress response protein NST1-like [Trichogramma pretiosum]|uniref:stress response protein NST1-like n=1 Tax=Trichogramma pretiosum TaxID=7493 RepID=UPI0006C9556A|nr:stress response protein NST1-like [Trichogramma pretiosum]